MNCKHARVQKEETDVLCSLVLLSFIARRKVSVQSETHHKKLEWIHA